MVREVLPELLRAATPLSGHTGSGGGAKSGGGGEVRLGLCSTCTGAAHAQRSAAFTCTGAALRSHAR